MKKAIRKVNFLYHTCWCRLYTDIMVVHLMTHHWDEFEMYRTHGLSIIQSLGMVFYKYYPKWAKHADKTIQYK